MAEHLRRQPRHPIAKRYPQEHPARVEVEYKIPAPHAGQKLERYDKGSPVCNCFPQPSASTVPSMFYDQIRCNHRHEAHIQPAQNTHFSYPWTANSVTREIARGIVSDNDDLSERFSLMSQEEEQLRFTPAFPTHHPRDVTSVATAPPFRYRQEMDPRNNPPYTAPVKNNNRGLFTPAGKHANSAQDVRSPDYRASRASNRQFTGNYIDPKDGKVYSYSVNYSRDGIDAARHPITEKES